ncbi:unnamed protein product [Clonostachys solani]|uniref:RGS domain-containing protein n=1 Tax=Clonostachys solani TaxID=160281 RepID=A0A9N9ZDN7_9HYPO|nr:unnamed protein product [Clonostachys solani]
MSYIQDEDDIGLRLDGAGIFYGVFATVWTAAVVAGITYLVSNRSSPTLRIRGLHLSICAVILLHCYWISVQIGYIVHNNMPGDGEYWIMGTWLPLGIAVFHASNSRFLHVAKAQKRFVDKVGEKPQTGSSKGVFGFYRRLDHINKVGVLVGAGITVQILTTIAMYLMSRKWHESWGIPGTEVHGATEYERREKMLRGWEWWHTVFWQFFWAWIFAPMILWRSRKIYDTQGWRLQTIACCVSSLHAAPMWLIALYVPQMDKVNRYFIPPQWIAVSIMFLEIFTIFLPCWQVMQQQNLRQEVLDTIAQWEAKSNFPVTSGKSMISGSTAIDSLGSKDSTLTSHSDESILTMGALEHVLQRNPGPLLEFSALQDFSGENIAFLVAVAAWKASFATEADAKEQGEGKELNTQYEDALRIYADYVSSRDAEFQVNLPSPIHKKLEDMFEKSTREAYGDRSEVNPATPFDVLDWPRRKASGSSGSSAITTTEEAGQVAEGFSKTIFDEAEQSIKYLVLTNTWPKFVKQRQSSMVVSMEV